MDANSMAILVLLGSFFLMVFLRFPIAYAVALSSVFCLLYQGHNLTTIRRYLRKAHCPGQCVCWLDARRHGNG